MSKLFFPRGYVSLQTTLKSDLTDVFATATRLEKKKYTLHPGTTDYMDRFIEEQDPSRDRSSSPNYHSLLYGADAKKSLSE